MVEGEGDGGALPFRGGNISSRSKEKSESVYLDAAVVSPSVLVNRFGTDRRQEPTGGRGKSERPLLSIDGSSVTVVTRETEMDDGR